MRLEKHYILEGNGRTAEYTEIGIGIYSGEKIDVSQPQHEGGNKRIYKAKVSHGELIFLIFLTRRETERPLLAGNSRQQKTCELSKLY